ncbi:MAG TPA: hypothetical protein VFW06_04840 [Acidimicrobiia bacterium]|nr:hypothetical protein [Acidimicrobiia bacterium]
MPPDRIRLEWMLNLVHPGQTFDNAIALPRDPGAPITAADVEASVEEFHQRNEAARLIEARSQEPVVRGIRLVTTGVVEQPRPVLLTPSDAAPAAGPPRRVHLAGAWHDAPVYDGTALFPGPAISGPALIAYPFTTVTLCPGDVARVLDDGDVLVDVPAPTS